MRRRLLGIVGNDTNALGILGANFSAGFVAGTIAAASTCPFDVAKTRRQIEVCPHRKIVYILITTPYLYVSPIFHKFRRTLVGQ